MPDTPETVAPNGAADAQTTTQTAAPAATSAATTPQTPTAPAASTQTQPVPRVEMTPEQLRVRLEEERTKAADRARKAVLDDLGVSLEEAKAKIAAAKALEEEKLSELQRRDAQIEALKPKAERAAVLEATVKAHADAQLAALTPEQRAAVESLAGGDPAAQLRAITALRPTWAASAAPAPSVGAVAAPTATTPAAPQPKPVPATTAPPAAPSPATVTNSPVSHLDHWRELQARHPMKAAAYFTIHYAAIAAERQARGE